MQFRVITIFPEVIDQYSKTGMLGRALAKKLISITAHDLRQWAGDRHGTVDDTPYGGGAGMVLKAEPIVKAVTFLKKKYTVKKNKQKVILLSAAGRRWTQTLAREYATAYDSLIFICGRYEGVDARIKAVVDEEISLGDFVVTGGELPALTVIDSVARLLPGVLGNTESLTMESHALTGILEHPHYTKPEVVVINKKKYTVPSVLLSGNHAAIAAWRQAHSFPQVPIKDKRQAKPKKR